MTQMESDEIGDGAVLVAVAVAALVAFVLGVFVGATGAWVTQ